MKHFIRCTLVALTLFSVPVLADPAQVPTPGIAEETLTLKVGGSKELTLQGLSRVAIWDEKVADIQTLGNNVLRVDGLKVGETTLVMWAGSVRKTYRIVVQA